MKLRLLAESTTKPETIEYLAEGIQRVVPVNLDLSAIGERYSKGRVWMCNLYGIGSRFTAEESDGYLLILTHSPFSYSREGLYPTFEWVGGQHERSYAGLCDNESRIIVIGGENSPSDGNVKLASHEIGHALLGHPATWNFEAIHCKNFIDSKRCIMNLQEEATREYLEEVYLGFCQSCTDAMKEKTK